METNSNLLLSIFSLLTKLPTLAQLLVAFVLVNGIIVLFFYFYAAKNEEKRISEKTSKREDDLLEQK